MADFDNTNRGVLFKNDRKTSEKHPDYKGTVNFNGVECWLSGWTKKSAKGTFMSLSVQPKEERAPPKKADPISSGRIGGDMDDEIPFAPEFR